MKTTVITISLCFAIAVAGGCKKHKAHWGYTGNEGPGHWGDLDPQFIKCKTGKTQSPINITGPFDPPGASLEINYEPADFEIVNNGHTIKVSYSGNSTITTNGQTFKLVQFHFHTPSEHKIDGKAADMVAHLVHQSATGKLAVIGLLFSAGEENNALKPVWSNLPKKENEPVTVKGVKMNAKDLLPENLSFYHYMGSLTTPPCSEDVTWFVLKNTVPASGEQIQAFTALFPKSVRPVQPLNGRKIQTDI